MIQQHFYNPISPGLRKAVTALVMVLLLGLLMPVFAQAYSVINAQPLLLGLASQQPDQPISVIVQKTIPGDSLEKQVAAIGGAVTSDLNFINSFGPTYRPGRCHSWRPGPGYGGFPWMLRW